MATGRADSLSMSGAQYRPGLEMQGEWGELELKVPEAAGSRQVEGTETRVQD